MTLFRPMHPVWLAWPLLSMLAACQPSADRAAAVATDAPATTAPATTPAVPASPWDAAAARGVAFRAIGNEPGWLVEVDRGDAPALRAMLDYGDRTIEVPRTAALDGALGYQGATADGTPVLLRIRREACSDGMSDLTYESSATLTVGDQTHEGCGRFLAD